MPDIFVDSDLVETPVVKEEAQQEDTVDRDQSPKIDKPQAVKKTGKNRLSAFQTYCEYPSGIRVDQLEQGEEILLFLRSHHVTNIPWIVTTFLLLLVPVALFPLLDAIFPSFLTISINFKIALVLFFYLITFGYALISFLQWFYNIGIIASSNILDIDYSQVVQVHVSATKVEKIEDVSFKQTGFIQTLFNYGDLDIQTAGSHPNFELRNIPNPDKAALMIQRLIRGEEHV